MAPAFRDGGKTRRELFLRPEIAVKSHPRPPAFCSYFGTEEELECGVQINPTARIHGDISVPGDKSISHRLAMLGSIADGTTTIHNFAASVDCRSTLRCLARL